ncbi:hypothetical protein ACFDX6_004437 [Salmonella enterica]|nr:hypothetical protein [Salmonella enterica]MCL9457661.1 hypothetical protein [Salmonella enterica subsp. enterica serovar Enteritidis]MDK9509850.1 hypothetical protein [Salmonella enterica subsp. enterica serovar Give]EHV4032186.1 hypothetical protein [Salmonella enterica]MCL9467440.1 hypothetical protein [Salmonella enterica subsp. enterica serovar Enteritidis]MCL9543422.1 hypothetical protein [Salmonella enterica subsp. enterica serovar Enteritidis]
MLAERPGKISREGLWHNGNQRDWRESMLIEGMMWQHTRKMIRLEMATARSALAGAKSRLAVERSALATVAAERDAMLAGRTK